MRSIFSWLMVFGLCCLTAAHARTVALALSGGGARGFAHIGILQVLEEENLEPGLIVGTSMGAVVGGLYAAGYSTAEIRSIAVNTDWSNLFLDRPARRNLFLAQKSTTSRHVVNLRFRGWAPDVPLALSSGQKISDKLFELVQRAPYHAWSSFDDLRIPFRAVATDLVSGQSIVFANGDLAEAMRASVSLPLVLVPYRLDSLLLVDGGTIENIPVDIAHAQGADVVVGVDLSTAMDPSGDFELPWDLADRVTTIMHVGRNAASRRTADLIIAPDIGAHKSSDFSNVAALIDSGYRAARAALPALRALLATSDSSLPPSGVPFCSRDLYQRFREPLAPQALPPRDYAFSGVHLVPESTAARLPTGPDGLARLALLRRTYVDNDLSLAHVTALALDSAGVLRSHWDEGRIRSLRVSGLRRHRPWTLLQEFPLEEGQVFDRRRAQRGLTQIYGSDLFESVTLSALPTDSGAHLTLRVRERESPQLRLGAGFSLERKGRAFIEFLNDNIFNLGARLALFGKYGERDEDLRARLTFDRLPLRLAIDRVLQSHVTIDLNAGWKREEFTFYASSHEPSAFYFFERTGAEFWAGRAFRRWGELAGGIRYEGVRAGGVFDEPTAHTTYLGVRTLIDTQDSYPFPTSGVAWDSRYEYALKSRQTGRAFNRLTALADGYVPLWHRTVAHARADYAWNDRIMPLWAQFPLGGEQSLLGLHVAERYGSAKLALLAELRHDLVSRWLADAYVSALYTVGAVSPKSEPFPDAADYQHGFGARLALSTFLGPMTFTGGELLRSRYGPDQWRFYVNLGHEF